MVRVAPFGAWASPLLAQTIVAGSRSFDDVRCDGERLIVTELRPSEGGRYALVQLDAEGQRHELLPMPYNARSRVHEYGGGAVCAEHGRLFFVNFKDQQWYELSADAVRPVTALPGQRFADAVYDLERGRLLCIAEEHAESGVHNRLVAIDVESGQLQVLVEGADFYASPRLSPDGRQLCWLAWQHPDMPWDATELWHARLDAQGCLLEVQQIAGGGEESVFQPEWSPGGVLHFCSDRSGWWNLYRWQAGEIEALTALEAEVGRPQWGFGMSCYAFFDEQHLLLAVNRQGIWQLATLQVGEDPCFLTHDYSVARRLRARAGGVALLTAAPQQPPAVVLYEPDSGTLRELAQSSPMHVSADWISKPQPISFVGAGGATSHAFFYPPHNPEFEAPADEKPPLLVISHGGPTSAAQAVLAWSIQYWTSRGIGVLDVNYGGSSGYGRAYRERLHGQWGIVDVEDCVRGATSLVERGLADGARLAIRGGSAGGFTTLRALTCSQRFAAGASYFGVSDLEALARDTHKFESRYLDRLIGAYPAEQHLYHARSPIHAAEGLSCPVIFLQGLEDKVVPPNQSERMVDVLRAKGLPVAYLTFEGEQHGFRKAENQQRALEAELAFYARVFGFAPADALPPLELENGED